MKSKTSIALLFLFIAVNLFAQDGFLTNLSVGKYLKKSTAYQITVNLRNFTNIPITSCTIYWQLDDGSQNATPVQMAGGGIVSNNYAVITLNSALSISEEGSHLLNVWVEVNGDTNPNNDQITKEVLALTEYADFRVLIEEYTATWCQYCPQANEVINNLDEDSKVVVASFHNNDEYSFLAGEAYMEAYYGGSIFTPGGVINMGEMGDYDINPQHPSWAGQVASRKEAISPVDLQLNVNADTVSRQITINIKANFKYAFSGNFYLNAYLSENNIEGDQTNATTPYFHQHVVRIMLEGSEGNNDILPQSPEVNTDYTHQIETTVPSGWNMKNLEVIAMIFEKVGTYRNALNAAKVRLFDQVGINENTNGNDPVSIYPNPAKDHITVHVATDLNELSELNIFDLTGKLVLSDKLNDSINQVIDLRALDRGIYFIRFTDGINVVGTSKLILR